MTHFQGASTNIILFLLRKKVQTSPLWRSHKLQTLRQCADNFYWSSPKSESEGGRQCTKCLQYTISAPADLYEAHDRSTSACLFVRNETCSNRRESQREQIFFFALRRSEVSGQIFLFRNPPTGLQRHYVHILCAE